MQYGPFSKIWFYLTLGYYKIISPLECQNYRLQVLLHEFIFLFTLLGLKKMKAESTTKTLLKTKFGNYLVRNIDIDIQIASPAYERLDMNELLRRIHYSLKRKRNVLFVDIGASFGKYTVAIGTRFKKYSKQLSILSFEPEPESYTLLKKNVVLNKLSHVKTFRIALSDAKSVQKFYYFTPMKQIVSFPTRQVISVKTAMLDNFKTYMPKKANLDVFIKLDIEGHEMKALKGGQKTIAKYKGFTVLIEDFAAATSRELIQYLSSHGVLLTKKTAYNSFWKLTS